MRSKKNIGKKVTRKISTRKNIGKKSYKNRTRKNYSKKKKGGTSEKTTDTDTFGLTKFVDERFLDEAFEAHEAEITKDKPQEFIDQLREKHESIKKTAQSTLIRIINSLNKYKVTREFFHIDQWGDLETMQREVVIIYTMLPYAVTKPRNTEYTEVDLLNFIYEQIELRYSLKYNKIVESLEPEVKEVFKNLIDLHNKIKELGILMGEEEPITYNFTNR